MINVLLFLLFSMAVQVQARSSSHPLSSKLLDNELRAVLDAKSTVALDAAIAEHEEIRSLRNECHVQLDRQRLPTLCFRVLVKEARAGLITEKKRKDQQAWLDQLCSRRLKLVRELSEIRQLLAESSLPGSCRTAAEERAADLKYTQEADHPSQLFDDRDVEILEVARTLQVSPSL